MEYYIGDKYLKNLHQIRWRMIYGYISIYRYFLNSPECLEMIKKSNKLETVLGDIESDYIE